MIFFCKVKSSLTPFFSKRSTNSKIYEPLAPSTYADNFTLSLSLSEHQPGQEIEGVVIQGVPPGSVIVVMGPIEFGVDDVLQGEFIL